MKKISLIIFAFLVFITPAFSLEVEKGKQLVIIDASSVIVSDGSIAEVVEGTNKISVNGLSAGKTSLFIWNSKGEMSVLPLTVLSEGAFVLRETLKNLNHSIENSSSDKRIRVTYGARGGFGEGISSLSSNQYNYSWDVEQLRLTGPTDVGNMESFLQFERRDSISQAVIMYTKIESDRFLAQAGDNWISLTPILGNTIRYQGFQLSNVDIKGNKFDFFAGSTGMAFWGNDVHRSNSLKTGFVGMRASGRIDKNLSVVGAFFTASQFNQPQELPGSSVQRFNLFSLDGIYDYGPFRLESEVAQSYKYKQGLSAQLSYAEPNLRYVAKYLSVDPEFRTLSDVYSTAGISGIFQEGNYKLSDQISTFGRFDAYSLQLINSSVLYDSSAGVDFHYPDYPTLRISANRWDHRNIPHGELDAALSVYSSYLIKSDNVRLFAQYSPDSFSSPTSPTSPSGINHRFRAGAETNTYPFVLSDEMGFDSKTLNSDSVLDRSVYNKFKATLFPVSVAKISNATIQLYMNSSVTRRYYRLTAPETFVSCELKASVLHWLGDELYLLYLREDTNAPSANTSVDAYNFEFGINNSFNTGVQLVSEQKRLKGVFFDDLNGNGLRDKGEPGLENYGLSSDIQSVRTNKIGEFEIAFERDQLISINDADYPNAKVQFQNPFPINLDTNQRIQEVLIPVSFEKSYDTVAYVDINKNSKYDEGIDSLLPNSLLRVVDSEGTASSFVNETGSMSFTVNSRPGKTYLVSIDLNTVNPAYIPNYADPSIKIDPNNTKADNTIYFGFVKQ